jgi:PAS domain S-box-containing protein
MNYMDYQKIRIKKLLKANPRGMTITDISKRININRNSVARYMDILNLSGQVEMRQLGPAKLFYLSQRVPMSAMLNFSSDYIMVLDNDLKIIQINEKFLKLMNINRDDIIGQSIEDCPNPSFSNQEMISQSRKSLEGKETNFEKKFQLAERELYLNTRMLPTIFEDGSSGVTWILHNITKRKKAEEDLKEANWLLRERVKELTFLYKTIREMQKTESLEELGPKIIDYLVKAMQFPEITAPKLEIEGRRFVHKNYREDLAHCIHEEIRINSHAIGRISVCYTEERPFIIPQEQDMIKALSETLGGWLKNMNVNLAPKLESK